MRPLQYVVVAALVVAALVVTGCGEPLRVALGARDITRERCTIRQGAGTVLAAAGPRIDAVGLGRGRVSCPSREGERSREVEVVAPTSLRIEGPTLLPYRDRAVYTLQATDEKGAPLAVGQVAWDYGRNLTSQHACGDFPLFGCPRWRESTRVRPSAGLRARLAAKLGRARAELTIRITPWHRQERLLLALGGRFEDLGYGTCAAAGTEGPLLREGSTWRAAREGSQELACTAADGAELTRLTVVVRTPERLLVETHDRPVLGSVEANFALRAQVPGAAAGSWRALHVGELAWRFSEHFLRSRRRCFTTHGICLQPVKAGKAWVVVTFAGKDVRKEIDVAASY